LALRQFNLRNVIALQILFFLLSSLKIESNPDINVALKVLFPWNVRHIFALLPSSFHRCQSSVNKFDRVRKKANFHNFLREDSAKFFARKSQKIWTRVDGSKEGYEQKTAAWSTLLAIDFRDDKSERPQIAFYCLI
jgi:hypothetical protein